jgi:hypothetical protein
MSKWAIRLGGEVVWTCNGVEELFDTEEDAVQAMIQESKEIEDDVRLGYLEDFSFEEYRIVEVV